MKNAIDLFSGCGGLSLGFMQNGYLISEAVEFDSTIGKTYRRNFPHTRLFVDDIRNIDESGIMSGVVADVIIGGPPCQGFSMAGSRIRSGFVDDPRNYLFKHYLHIVKTVHPKVFIMENVKGMLSMNDGKIFSEIKSSFENADYFCGDPYSVFWKVENASDFGIPQNRERLVIIGVRGSLIDFESAWESARKDARAIFPYFFDDVTIRDAIGNLPPASQDGIVKNPKPKCSYQEYLSSPEGVISNHMPSKHSKRVIDRMSRVGPGENYEVLDEKIKSVHSGAYGRLRWSDRSTTITTRFDTPAGGRFTHPSFDRTLTPREAARIQSFPDSFIFQGDRRSISRQIGNAVPPKLAFFLSLLADRLIEQVDACEANQ